MFLKTSAILLMLFLSIALTGYAQSRVERDCGNAQTQAEMNQCAKQAFEAADQQLNQLYKTLMDRLQALQQGESGGGDAYHRTFQEKIRESQRQWVKLRNANAEIANHQFLGGSIAPLMQYTQMTTDTEARINFLQALLEELQ